jgi:SdpC family antimicrobial peptide
MKLITAAVTLTAVVAMGSVTAANADQRDAFSDEQIVRGLVFGQGEFADRINTRVELPEDLDGPGLKKYDEVMDNIVTDLVGNTSYGTDRSIEAVKSGDPYETLSAFDDLREAFEKSLRSQYPEVISERSDAMQPRVCGPTVCAAALVAVIAVGTVLAAVNFNVAGNVNMVVNQNGLWSNNGVFGSRSTPRVDGNLPSPDPARIVEQYPHLNESEVAARVATVFA